jgi:hypothetical protein
MRVVFYYRWSKPFFPTRLLDVRTPTIRLIDGQDLKPSDGGYVALSYCGGEHNAGDWQDNVINNGSTAGGY